MFCTIIFTVKGSSQVFLDIWFFFNFSFSKSIIILFLQLLPHSFAILTETPTRRLISQSYASNLPSFGNARRLMNDIKHFDTFFSDAVDNLMRIKDNVAIHVAFGGNLQTWRIRHIITGQASDRFQYFIVVTNSLNIAEGDIRIPINICKAVLECFGYYDRFFKNSFFHAVCSFSKSSNDINSPSSMLRICSINSSCVPVNTLLGSQLLIFVSAVRTASSYCFCISKIFFAKVTTFSKKTFFSQKNYYLCILKICRLLLCKSMIISTK